MISKKSKSIFSGTQISETELGAKNFLFQDQDKGKFQKIFDEVAESFENGTLIKDILGLKMQYEQEETNTLIYASQSDSERIRDARQAMNKDHSLHSKISITDLDDGKQAFLFSDVDIEYDMTFDPNMNIRDARQSMINNTETSYVTGSVIFEAGSPPKISLKAMQHDSNLEMPRDISGDYKLNISNNSPEAILGEIRRVLGKNKGEGEKLYSGYKEVDEATFKKKAGITI